MGEGMTEEERKLKQQKAMADPEIQNILTDPVMRQVGVFDILTQQLCKRPCSLHVLCSRRDHTSA